MVEVVNATESLLKKKFGRRYELPPEPPTIIVPSAARVAVSMLVSRLRKMVP